MSSGGTERKIHLHKCLGLIISGKKILPINNQNGVISVIPTGRSERKRRTERLQQTYCTAQMVFELSLTSQLHYTCAIDMHQDCLYTLCR